MAIAFTLAAPLLGKPNPLVETWSEKFNPAGIQDVRLTFSGLGKGGRGTPGNDTANSRAGKSGVTERSEPGVHVLCSATASYYQGNLRKGAESARGQREWGKK